jgi:predicted aldo/keto reductase-like oxidoreductase
MKRFSRRTFLKTGAAGAGLIALSPSAISIGNSTQERNIIYRILGRTGLKVPVISFGVMRADNPGLCKAAYEKGIKLFDTANGYQGGNNETMLGNLFRDYPRDSFIIVTKVKANTDREGKPAGNTTADAFNEMFSTSLSRLKMDYVDILHVHDISNPEFLEYKPVVNAIQKLKKDGKAKFIGFSTHRNEPQVISAAADLNTWDVITTQYNYRYSAMDDINRAIKKAAEAGIGIIAMKTLAGGGFLDRERTKPMNTSAAIKWVLSNPYVSTTIPGMTSYDHLAANENLLTDITLNDQEKNDLVAALLEPGLYCTGCTKCVASCPFKLPVRDLMRAYMYAYGYSNASMAKDLLTELGITGNPCENCNVCSVNCSQNFNIKEKIADIMRLADVPSEFLA